MSFDIVLTEQQKEEGMRSRYKFLSLWKTENWDVEVEVSDIKKP